MRQALSNNIAVGPLLIFVTMARLILAAKIGLTPDEVYYWIWSQHLQGGYLDHPPAVAFIIRAGTWVWGDTTFGIRFFEPILALAGSFFLINAGRDLMGRREDGIKAALLLNATLFLGVGAATMTPDTPLLFFNTLALWALGRLYVTKRPEWWLLIGAAFGLGFDSKYTAVLPALACGIWWLFSPRKPPFKWVAGGALTGWLFISPVLLWNAQHHWASFLKQGGRAQDWAPSRAAQFCGELLGGQIGLATPLIFLLCVSGVIAAVRRARRGDALWLLSAMVVLPGGVFLQHALGGRVQANWPIILYPAAILLATHMRGVASAACLGYVMTGLIYLQALAHIIPLSPHHDIVARQTGGWRDFAQHLARENQGQAVIFRDYAQASLIHFYAPELTIYSTDPRWFYLDRPVGREGAALLVEKQESRDAILRGWVAASPNPTSLCRKARRQNIKCYRLTPIKNSGKDSVIMRQVG